MTSPTHPKAPRYLRGQIFDGLKNFHEFEARISALATAQERGDAFEVFAEAYLATVAVEKAKQVWPGASVPPSLRKRLALTVGDNGVDGVFETQLGEYHAYQSKFRTGRPSLTWDELSTFIGLADRVAQRVLITNCDRFAGLVKDRTAFYAITGNDLDKLEPRDFAAIRAWLEGARVERTPKTPLPHQAEALDDILPALREHDRATGLMACGTGKTLVALWVAEKVAQAILPASQNTQAGVPVPLILVLVPSLALLRQTLHEWARETSWRSWVHLCVCSDPTVKPDSDEIVLRSNELDFPVTTDSAHVRAFFAARFDGVKLVFATYQSAHVVAAGMKRGDAFDLAIFDEAHKTAGREGVHFGFALNDRNLAIRKRLFLTATLRHYDVRQRDKEGDARLVYSMDAPEVYRPVAHKLTFAEAARRGIICGYKVIISVVTSDMVNDHLLRHGEVIVKGDAVRARHVANQLALQAAVARHGVGKIFTFHRSVASAAAFTGDGPEGIGNHLSGFDAFHVNGSMPTSERENIMTEFRAASRAVISNAKCLTEGVDVPAVDMVAFLTPKRSRVDIVQATGRAMRKAHGKTTGYVLVPLFVEQAKGETIEQALARTEFDEVWNVLQAMQEQDDTLAEIIRRMREERGRIKGFDDTTFRETVETLGPQISLDALRDSITTACVEALSDTWDEQYGQMKAFQERIGHCNVPVRDLEYLRLRCWVTSQRSLKKSGRLSACRIKRLDELGFTWDAHKDAWEEKFKQLAGYKETHGHCNIPPNWIENIELSQWVAAQRSRNKAKKLGDERTRRLNEIGFVWRPIDVEWEQMFALLSRYNDEHGHCNVPINVRSFSKLRGWITWNHSMRRCNKLSPERLQRLDHIGFIWDVENWKWDEMFAAYVAFRCKHLTGDLTHNVGRDNPQLLRWVKDQCSLKKHGKLPRDRVRQLDSVGFDWHFEWDQMFAALVEYKRIHGDCAVPMIRRVNPKLASWVTLQRQQKKTRTIDESIKRRLDAIGFVWDVRESDWEMMFSAMEEYQRAHGNCDVPMFESECPELSRWVTTQRAIGRGKMQEHRAKRLDALGFTWDARTLPWEEMFQTFVAYKQAHGTGGLSPNVGRDDPQLLPWINDQCSLKEHGKLSSDRIRQLDSVGFNWQFEWEQMFAALLEWKRIHGDCAMHIIRRDYPKLATWIALQRHQKKTHKIEESNKRCLDAIGFAWDVHEGRWEKMFSEMEEYQRAHGNCDVPMFDSECPELSRWVTTQRAIGRGKMQEKRAKRLDALGFTWDARKLLWEEMFQALVAYKQAHDNCDVPIYWPDNRELRRWVQTQRSLRRKRMLEDDCICRLDALGFQWKTS